ncbi:YhgE/Pip family protein [Nocardioides sp. YIM 152588]|uniref:YhgE/Pip domain-containing protein n=1 Tax=Nocardioides sp. YIM 152588 TaxID=3158259 RepID=UPI0032E4FA98
MSTTDTTGTAPGSRALAWRRLALAGLVLPLLAATVLVWATTSRPDHLDKIPVAVVNNDKIITDPQPMAAGRALAAALTQPSPGQSNLDWVLADTADAAQGLADGDYYAVLTIPEDFSKSILSTGTDDPAQGKLQLVSNGAASSTVPYISEVVASQAAASLGRQSTEGYLGQVYAGLNTLASSTAKAATSGGQLADGTAQLADGAAQLDSGAGPPGRPSRSGPSVAPPRASAR